MSNIFTFNPVNSFIIGICIGSFLNVVIYRLPNNISIIKPRSFCPKCKNKISWRENIPILSWLIQKGKCNNCRENIGIRYPLIELLIGIFFIIFSKSNPYLYNSININFTFVNFFETIFSWFFLCLLIVISFIDLKHFWIPQMLINLGFLFGGLNLFCIQILSNFNESRLIIECFSASILSYILFELVRISAKYFYKKDALGKGDSKLIAMIALWLGGFGMVFSISITYIFAAFCLLTAMNLKLIKRNQLIPFAPFLSLGGLIVWFFGNQTLIQNFIQ